MFRRSSFRLQPSQESLPDAYHRVDEGEFVVAAPNAASHHIVTIGLITCKAAVLYHRGSRRGLVAHLCFREGARQQFANIREAFGVDVLPESEGYLICGPDNDTQTGSFYDNRTAIEHMRTLGLSKLRIDRACPLGMLERGVMLNLEQGSISEIDSATARTETSTVLRSLAQPLCKTDTIMFL